MTKSILGLRQWDILWCSKKKRIWANLNVDPVRFFEDKQEKIINLYTLN